MTFTVTGLSRCVGLGHYKLTVTVAGQPYVLSFHRDDLALDPDDIPEAVLTRCRSAVKEADAETFAQAQAALVGQTFEV